ncbi:uncharacterized protein [Watersipora subatra]|uniref:uncharacterized protein n=1 Tax=Watersipora subatra TaxID=2589382 RepID=UPI00355B65DB
MVLAEPMPATYATINARSKIECGVFCTNTQDCQVFVYSKHSHSCEFLNISDVFSWPDTNAIPMVEAYVLTPTDPLLARGKPAESISTGSSNRSADKAVDGQYSDGNPEKAFFITSYHVNLWWRVDLERRHCIQAVNILNRGVVTVAVCWSVGTKAQCMLRYHKMALSESMLAAYATTNARSKIECGVFCTNTPDCHVFVYFKHSHSCEFLNISEIGSWPDINTTHIVDAYVLPRTDTLLARGKPAESISAVTPDNNADKAVDGRYSDGSSLVATRNHLNPWWRVDLEKCYCIQAVNILNRDYMYNRTKNLVITTADEVSQLLYTSDDGENFCGRHDGILNKYYTLIKCVSVVAGRFVHLQLNTTGVFNIYEVEVHGYYDAP